MRRIDLVSRTFDPLSINIYIGVDCVVARGICTEHRTIIGINPDSGDMNLERVINPRLGIDWLFSPSRLLAIQRSYGAEQKEENNNDLIHLWPRLFVESLIGLPEKDTKLFREAGDGTTPYVSVWEDNLIDLMNWGFALLMIVLYDSSLVVAWKKAMLIVGI
jgi:hypothetical protein